MMPRTVDRSIARMIATKRIITGTLALMAGVAMTVIALMHGASPTPQLGLALLIFFAGGVWTLRDGLRLRRELANTAPPSPASAQ